MDGFDGHPPAPPNPESLRDGGVSPFPHGVPLAKGGLLSYPTQRVVELNYLRLNNHSLNSLPQFKSAPWCLNGHVHTVLSSILFEPAYVNYKRTVIDTPDGDFLNLDLLETDEHAPVVILLHGLEGSSKRYYVQNLAHHLLQSGYNIIALNFRSCGGKLNNTRTFYHSGETEDLRNVCTWAKNRFSDSPIFAAGYSLGGSVLLNYLKKYGADSIIESFVAVSVPYDLYRGSLNLQKGINRLYDYRFLRTLKKKLKLKRRVFSDLPVFTGSTLYEFDDQVTAPLHGFEDARDYYTRCSSAFFMHRIDTPGLLIHSREDPLCPFEFTPHEAIEENPNLTTAFPERGGHVGFWSLPPGWVELTAEYYFDAQRSRL